MTELTDRLVILLIAGGALAAMTLGWGRGLIQGQDAGAEQYVLLGAGALVLVGVLVGVWFAFDRIETRRG